MLYQSLVCYPIGIIELINLILFFFFIGQSLSSLTLQNIKRSDEGEYTCLGSNSIGQGQSSVHIRVQCNENKKKMFLL